MMSSSLPYCPGVLVMLVPLGSRVGSSLIFGRNMTKKLLGKLSMLILILALALSPALGTSVMAAGPGGHGKPDNIPPMCGDHPGGGTADQGIEKNPLCNE